MVRPYPYRNETRCRLGVAASLRVRGTALVVGGAALLSTTSSDGSEAPSSKMGLSVAASPLEVSRCEASGTANLPALPLQEVPPYLKPVVDPTTGARVVRVSAPGEPVPGLPLNWGDVARHHYSLDQPWSADKALLMLDRGMPGLLFLDGRTFEPLFVRRARGESRWHPQMPGTQILLDGQTLSLWDVRSDASTKIETFTGYRRLAFGPNKGNPSQDGRMVALVAKDATGRQVAFAYDLVTRRKFPDIDLSDKQVSYVTISPSGRYIVVHGKLWGEVQAKGDQTEVLDLLGRRVGPAWAEYGRPSHFDLGFDAAGEEVAVGVSKSSPNLWHVIKRRLRDGAVTSLSEKPGFASHTSLRASEHPGWGFVTFGSGEDRKGWLPYRQEIVAIKLDGSGEGVRVARTLSTGTPYEAEAHGVPSPDGCKVAFASDWGIPGARSALLSPTRRRVAGSTALGMELEHVGTQHAIGPSSRRHARKKREVAW